MDENESKISVRDCDMEESKIKKTVERMTNARACIIRDNPFFGHLAMRLSLACAPCGTACTDGSRLIFDPEFAVRMSDREMQFVILHEVLHCVLGHCLRGKALNSLLFNAACDIVVNSTILEMWGLDTIDIAGEEAMHLTPTMQEGRLFSAEEVYHMLLSDKSSPDTSGGNSGFDRHDLWQGICDKAQMKDRWNTHIRDAIRTCGGTSGMPQRIRKLAESLDRRSGIDWRQLLHDFIQYDLFDYSFLPPDRRYSAGDFFMPAYNADEENGSVKNIWICVDTSGSVTDRELSDVIAELLDAVRQAGLSGKLSFFDSAVSEPTAFETEKELRKITPVGGGGTSFKAIFKYMRENMYHDLPRAVLIFTDGYAAWPAEEDAAGVPVLWLICAGGRADVPWGKAVMLPSVR